MVFGCLGVFGSVWLCLALFGLFDLFGLFSRFSLFSLFVFLVILSFCPFGLFGESGLFPPRKDNLSKFRNFLTVCLKSHWRWW